MKKKRTTTNLRPTMLFIPLESPMPPEDNSNPYASPTATPTEARRRSRLRIIPVTLMAIYGSFGIVVAPVMLFVLFHRAVEAGVVAALILGTSLTFVASALWLLTAVLCWKGKWRWMILTFLVAFATSFFAEQIMRGAGVA